MSIKRLSIFALALAAGLAQAEPAPWYWWVSRLDGTRICNQTPPGDGWLMETTPFKDARCRVRLNSR